MYIVTLISMIFLFPPCLQSYGSRKIGLWGRSWPTVRSAKRQRHSELKVFCSHHITYSVNSGTYLALTAETDAVPGQFAEESAGRTDSVVVTFTCLKRIFFCPVWFGLIKDSYNCLFTTVLMLFVFVLLMFECWVRFGLKRYKWHIFWHQINEEVFLKWIQLVIVISNRFLFRHLSDSSQWTATITVDFTEDKKVKKNFATTWPIYNFGV